MTVRVRDNGAARLRAALRARVASAVEVGVLGADAAKAYDGGDEPITVADVARWAEFGLGQPRRSWLKDTIEIKRAELLERMRAEAQAVARGERTKPEALTRIGLWIEGEIKQRIANGIDPPNAETTIERKGSSTPLIDTGQLRSSITHRLS